VSRASLSLLLAATLLLLILTSNASGPRDGISFPTRGTDHGYISQLGSQPDFQMQIPPNQFLVKSGTSANISIYFTPLNGFSGNVTLSGTVSPNGSSSPTISLPPIAMVNWTISGIPHYFMIVNTTIATPLGFYTVTVYGVSGSITHTATVTLGITSIFVPSNGSEMLYKANFTNVAYAGHSTVLNSTFEDLGYLSIGISSLTIATAFGTFQDNNGTYCTQNCWLAIVSPFAEKTASFTILIPANTSPGNYSVTMTISWALQPGNFLYQTAAPDLVTQGSIIVYSNAPGLTGLPSLSGLTSLLLAVLGGVAASAAIMLVALSLVERRRKNPFKGLVTSSGTLQPVGPMMTCDSCGATVPKARLCPICHDILS